MAFHPGQLLQGLGREGSDALLKRSILSAKKEVDKV